MVLTSNAKYDNRITMSKATQELADAAIEVCSQCAVSFNQMAVLLMNLQNPMVRGFDLPFSITREHAERLHPLANRADPIEASDFSAVFWETLYERIRREDRLTCPSRLKSYFASRDVDSLRRYRDEHWANKMADKMACEIEVSGCSVAFEADMVILDKVSEDMSFESARPHVLRYWDQEMSPNPNVEILLQGTVKLGKPVAL